VEAPILHDPLATEIVDGLDFDTETVRLPIGSARPRSALVVRLVAPDGTVYTLLDKVGGGTDDVHQTFVVDLAGEPADGTWQLRVHDTVAGHTGTLTGWTLTHNL
jgi:subtilisin-like proprotein convertase family protein